MWSDCVPFLSRTGVRQFLWASRTLGPVSLTSTIGHCGSFAACWYPIKDSLERRQVKYHLHYSQPLRCRLSRAIKSPGVTARWVYVLWDIAKSRSGKTIDFCSVCRVSMTSGRMFGGWNLACDCCYDMFLSHLRGDAYKSRSTPFSSSAAALLLCPDVPLPHLLHRRRRP